MYSLLLFLLQNANAGVRKLRDLLELALKQPRYSRCLSEDNTLLLRFAADGAKIAKHRDSVRAVFKILPPRGALSKDTVTSSPDDELTLLFYMGKDCVPLMHVLPISLYTMYCTTVNFCIIFLCILV